MITGRVGLGEYINSEENQENLLHMPLIFRIAIVKGVTSAAVDKITAP